MYSVNNSYTMKTYSGTVFLVEKKVTRFMVMMKTLGSNPVAAFKHLKV